MTKTAQRNIFKRYGLDVKEVETNVYKVMNTDKEVNISCLQWDLKECTTIASDRIRLEKENHTGMVIACVYYILNEHGNREKAWKYQTYAINEFGNAVIRGYSEDEENKQHSSIDTLYKIGE